MVELRPHPKFDGASHQNSKPDRKGANRSKRGPAHKIGACRAVQNCANNKRNEVPVVAEQRQSEKGQRQTK
jgi:hypothetical protein